jgi:hypothetical protein
VVRDTRHLYKSKESFTLIGRVNANNEAHREFSIFSDVVLPLMKNMDGLLRQVLGGFVQRYRNLWYRENH